MSANDLVYVPVPDNGSDTGEGANFNLSGGGELKNNALHVLVREQLQNSIDAYNEMGSNKPNVLRFSVTRKYFDSKLIKTPELKVHINHCYEYRKSNAGTESGSLPDEVVRLKHAIDKLKEDGNMFSTNFEDNAGGIRGTTRNLRLEQDTVWEKFLGRGETTKFGKNSLGSFGVGKFAAWNDNDTFTVYYLNTFKGKSYFIGRTMLSTYYTKESGSDGWSKKWDKDLYFGKRGKNTNGAEIADLYEINEADDAEFLKTFRTLEGDGLTTIIPTLKTTFDKNEEWAKEVAYSIVQSFFRAFEKGVLEVRIVDDYGEEEIVLTTENYKEKYEGFKSLESLVDPDDLYQYYLLKPQILGKKASVFERNFTVGGYKGKAVLSVYKNEELQEMLEENRDSKKRKTFRIIRENMLIRNEAFPRNRINLEENEHSGVVEFEAEGLNSIIKKGETKSHDKIEMDNYKGLSDTSFPSESSVVRFYQNLSRWVKEEVDKLSGVEIKDGDKGFLDLDLGGLFGGSEIPSFDRTLVDNEKRPEHHTNDDGSRRVINKGVDTNNQEGKKKGVVEIDGRGKKKREKRTKRKTYRKKTNSGLVDDSVQSTNRISVLEKISLFQKISSAGGSNNKYKIQLNNVKDTVDLVLSQETAFEKAESNAFLSFRVDSIEMNGYAFFDFKSSKNTYGDVISYTLKGLKPVNNKIILDLSVTEPSETESKFKIKLS